MIRQYQPYSDMVRILRANSGNRPEIHNDSITHIWIRIDAKMRGWS
jgi:hypothetical protein